MVVQKLKQPIASEGQENGNKVDQWEEYLYQTVEQLYVTGFRVAIVEKQVDSTQPRRKLVT